MTRYLAERGLHSLVTLFIITLITFGLIQLAPGGPAILTNNELTEADRAALRRTLGIDEPLPVQYARWVGNLAQGNFGRSLNDRRPVLTLIMDRLPNTLLLASIAFVLSLLLAIPVGVLSATRTYSAYDYLATFISFVGISIPVFWFGIMLILIFSVTLRWLPAAGMATVGAPFSLDDRIQHLIMPALVLSIATTGALIRYTRSSLLSVLAEDYVRTARAKGLREAATIYRHALRNALIPVVTVIGLRLPFLISGAVVTETIFAWPGMGRLAVDATFGRDYPTIMGITLIIAVMIILSNLITDIVYVYVDPRVKLG